MGEKRMRGEIKPFLPFYEGFCFCFCTCRKALESHKTTRGL